eukprot:TRINITY_DN3692_c0_g1_i1.p1 TRINITY_DN3692_c0_g1~~TRINITY_DN3692_c0_g1_i1.p1  ORF type:complete len:425 (-),score=101.72 TRINITY_DN3692_c0_g1_i1:195-1382(-)
MGIKTERSDEFTIVIEGINEAMSRWIARLIVVVGFVLLLSPRCASPLTPPRNRGGSERALVPMAPDDSLGAFIAKLGEVNKGNSIKGLSQNLEAVSQELEHLVETTKQQQRLKSSALRNQIKRFRDDVAQAKTNQTNLKHRLVSLDERKEYLEREISKLSDTIVRSQEALETVSSNGQSAQKKSSEAAEIALSMLKAIDEFIELLSGMSNRQKEEVVAADIMDLRKGMNNVKKTLSAGPTAGGTMTMFEATMKMIMRFRPKETDREQFTDVIKLMTNLRKATADFYSDVLGDAKVNQEMGKQRGDQLRSETEETRRRQAEQEELLIAVRRETSEVTEALAVIEDVLAQSEEQLQKYEDFLRSEDHSSAQLVAHYENELSAVNAFLNSLNHLSFSM